MATIRTTYKFACDLDKGTYEVNLRTPLMQADAMADAFQVSVKRNGVDVNVAGMTAYGYLYIAAAQTTIAIRGTVSGNTASVVLNEDCYAVPGYASLVIQLHEGDVRHAVLKVNLYIERTGSNRVLTGGDVLPTLAELLNKISAMEQATATANATIATIKADTAAAIEATNKATAATQTATVELAKTAAPAITPTVSGSIVSITDGAARPAVSLITHIEPVQEGEGEPSPDNVRAIRGWDKIGAYRAKNNLLPNNLTGETKNGVTVTRNADNSLTIRGTLASETFWWLVTGTNFALPVGHTLFARMSLDTRVQMRIFFYSGDDELLSTAIIGGTGQFVVPQHAYCTVRLQIASLGEYNLTAYPSITVGIITASEYEPYQGQTLSADLPEKVYGGTLDWNTGVLHSTLHKLVFDGVTTGAKLSGADMGRTDMAYIYSAHMAVKGDPSGTVTTSHGIRASLSANGAINIYMPEDITGAVSDDTVDVVVAKFNAVLAAWYDAGTPLEVVYTVATPAEIQLTPQQLTTLRGTNNVWSSTGDTDLTYIADTQLYIDQRIAALLASN